MTGRAQDSRQGTTQDASIQAISPTTLQRLATIHHDSSIAHIVKSGSGSDCAQDHACGEDGIPRSRKVLVASVRQQVGSKLSCQWPIPATGTTRLLGIVACAFATLPGGSTGSVVPLRNTMGADDVTAPLAPTACGQYLHTILTPVACRIS